MESVRHKLIITFLVLCLIAVAATIWYMIMALPDGFEKEGTFVRSLFRMGESIV